MKKWFLVWPAILAMSMIVSACGSASSDQVGQVVEYIETLNSGNQQEAISYVCEGEEEGIREGLQAPAVNERAQVTFDNIRCVAQGEDVQCTYDIIQEFDDGTQETVNREAIFMFQDGLICGYQEVLR